MNRRVRKAASTREGSTEPQGIDIATLGPESIAALLGAAVKLHQAGRLAEAEVWYRRFLSVRPDHADALNSLGLLAQQTGRHDLAVALFGRAAEAYVKHGRLEEGLASCDRVLALRGEVAEVLCNRGNILRGLRRFEEALASYDRALTRRPDYADALTNRGLALHALRRFEEALTSHDRALSLQPDLAEALANRGLALHALGRFEEALASHDRALALRPNVAEVLANRGLTLHRLDRSKEALASLDLALAVQPDYAEAHNLVGITLTALGRLTEARAALQRAVALAPDDVRYRRNLGEVRRFVPGDAHLAALEKAAQRAATLSIDERIELHFALGKAYDDLGRHAEAFAQWLEGNALKRREISYDEAARLQRLNGIRAVFTSELIGKWQNAGHPSPDPVFIVGMARSGSTLVEQIVASHPQVFGAGELDYFGEAVKKTRTRFGGSDELLVSGMAADDFRDLGARYLAELQRLAPQAIRITDKLPENFMLVGLIHLALPNAPIIHTVRDPVDTCLSCFSNLFEAQDHTYDLAEVGRYYRHYQALMAHWHRVLPAGRILDVRYEDVVADLEGQARRIIAHCGLSWDPRCLEFHQTERPVVTVSAPQVRQPIYNSAVGRWRVHEKSLAPLLAELGVTDIARQSQDASYHFNLGNALYSQGGIDEAVAAYREAIRIKPDYAEAHCNLGNVLKAKGQLDEAVGAYRAAIGSKPDYAKAHYNLGLALREHGKLDEAVAALRHTIAIEPNMAEAHSDLGVALQELGKLDEAVAAYRQATRIKPDYDKPLHNLGIVLKEQGKIDEAIAAWRQAIGIKPGSAEARSDLGHALTLEGKLDEAVAACKHAIRIKPDHAEAYCNLGNALRQLGKLDDAIAAYREAIRIKPTFAEFHSNLGVALAERGKLDEAVAAHREAISQKPDYAVGHSNLGVGLQEQGRLEEAVAAYRKAISLKPHFAEAHSNLGNALCKAGSLDEAVATCRQAIGIKPDYAEAQCNLGVALQYQGKLEEAAAAYRKAIDIKPEHARTLSNLLFCLNYNENLSNSELFAAHCEWDERYGREARPAAYANERDPQRRLKIGYVSPDFRVHSVAYFLEPLLQAHDRQAVEVFCYADVSRPDGLTEHLQGLAEHWLVTVGLSDDELTERIRSDGIDILVDLAGHTADNRLRVFARKPAPVQVTWLGYPNTTGLSAIDYRLVDTVTDPPGQSDAWASETLLRLDGGFLCYGGFEDLPDPKPPPCLTSSTVTFGSFNNLAKLSTATIEAWASLLSRMPHARLLLKGKSLGDPATRALYQTRLIERGVPAERLQLIPALLSAVAHLAAYELVDVALDPFSYNGTTTTCEALWMGVPVVTLRGDRHAGRVGASLLTQVGLTDLIAESVDEYVESAIALARDSARLSALRQSLRPRMLASPLCDSRAFARKMEAAFRSMWQRWCEAAG